MIAPLFAVLVVVIFCFMALAVDLGVMALARTQCQNAADSVALGGARDLNGDGTKDNNYTGAMSQATTVAGQNYVLGQAIPAGNLTTEIGTYAYNGTAFQSGYPAYTSGNGVNWTLVKGTVTSGTSNFFFAPVFEMLPVASGGNMRTFSTAATATAVHRPRDVGIIMDFSGSMGEDTSWTDSFNPPSLSNASGSATNINHQILPTYGHYSGSHGMQDAGATEDNLLRDTSNGARIIADFWSHTALPDPTAGTPAFTDAGGSAATPLSGDNFPRNYAGTAFAQTIDDIVGGAVGSVSNATALTRLQAAAPYNNFQGYTQGPGYFGKTFFMWPPGGYTSGSYNTALDWRYRFFTNAAGGPVDPTTLYNGSGQWMSPRNGYRINYNAILTWITSTGPTVFPTQLRSGRLMYYSAIPTGISTATIAGRYNYSPASWAPFEDLGGDQDALNQRFWKEYIDYVLLTRQTSSNISTGWYTTNGNSNGPSRSALLHGDDFDWGTNNQPSASVNGFPCGRTHAPYRPRLHFWFGPMSMADFCTKIAFSGADANHFVSWSGVFHQATLWQLKAGINAVLEDIEKNHPNDYVSLAFFSQPRATDISDPATILDGRFNRIRAPLGRDYTRMKGALWYPPGAMTGTTQTTWKNISAWDDNGAKESPWAMGATCYAMPMMQIYNQFSTNVSLQTHSTTAPNDIPGAPLGESGGLGRRGAQKLMILETDGDPNTRATASLTPVADTQHYYQIRPKNTDASSQLPGSEGNEGNGATVVVNQIYAVANKLCALENNQGYATARKPVFIHCILFEGNGASATALTVLGQVQVIGQTGSPLQDWKRISGTPTQVTDKLQTAFTRIMQDGLQLALIE